MQQPTNMVPRKILVLDIAILDKTAPGDGALFLSAEYSDGLFSMLKAFKEKMGFEIIVTHASFLLGIQEQTNIRRLNRNISFCNIDRFSEDLENADKSLIYFFSEDMPTIESMKKEGFVNLCRVNSSIERNGKEQYELKSDLVEQLSNVIYSKFDAFVENTQQQGVASKIITATPTPRALPQPGMQPSINNSTPVQPQTTPRPQPSALRVQPKIPVVQQPVTVDIKPVERKDIPEAKSLVSAEVQSGEEVIRKMGRGQSSRQAQEFSKPVASSPNVQSVNPGSIVTRGQPQVVSLAGSQSDLRPQLRSLPQPIIPTSVVQKDVLQIIDTEEKTPTGKNERVNSYLKMNNSHEPVSLGASSLTLTGHKAYNRKANLFVKNFATTLYSAIVDEDGLNAEKKVLPKISLNSEGILSITISASSPEIKHIKKQFASDVDFFQKFGATDASVGSCFKFDSSGNLQYELKNPEKLKGFLDTCDVSSRFNIEELYQNLCKDNGLVFDQIWAKYNQTQNQVGDSEEGFFSSVTSLFNNLTK